MLTSAATAGSFLSLVARDVDPNNSIVRGSVIVLTVLVWTNDAIGERNPLLLNMLKSNTSAALATSNVLIHVLFNHLAKLGLPDMVMDNMLTNYSLTTSGGFVRDWTHKFFHNVQIFANAFLRWDLTFSAITFRNGGWIKSSLSSEASPGSTSFSSAP